MKHKKYCMIDFSYGRERETHCVANQAMIEMKLLNMSNIEDWMSSCQPWLVHMHTTLIAEDNGANYDTFESKYNHKYLRRW